MPASRAGVPSPRPRSATRRRGSRNQARSSRPWRARPQGLSRSRLAYPHSRARRYLSIGNRRPHELRFADRGPHLDAGLAYAARSLRRRGLGDDIGDTFFLATAVSIPRRVAGGWRGCPPSSCARRAIAGHRTRCQWLRTGRARKNAKKTWRGGCSTAPTRRRSQLAGGPYARLGLITFRLCLAAGRADQHRTLPGPPAVASRRLLSVA